MSPPSAASADRPSESTLPRWRVFPAIALGVVMATLDASVVNIALPTLQKAFAAPFATVTWVALAYSVTITGLLLSAGRLADLRGRRRVYGIGLAIFTGSSLLCGLSPGAGALIAARVLQGVGAALVSANGSALLVSSFPAEERGKVLGAFGAMVGVGLALGSPLGGFVVQAFSWRWVFFLNVPLGLLAMFLLRRDVPDDVPSRNAPPLEWRAAALWCGALVALVLALSRGPEIGWRNPLVTALFAASSALLALFVWSESRSAHPMLPPRILIGPLGAAVSLTLIGQMLTVAIGFQIPFYVSHMFGDGARAAGMWNTVLPLAALLFAPFAGRLADRTGARILTTLGLGMTAAGFFVLSLMGAPLSPWPLMPIGLALIGAGMGLFTVPNASALLSLVPHDQLGIASGLQNTTRYLGTTSGLALMGALIASRYVTHAGRPLAAPGGSFDRSGYGGAMHDACLVLAGLALLATVSAAIQHRGPVARRVAD